MGKTGLFVGSFDPYTIGHADIVNRALKLFDSLVIGVGVNPGKHTTLSADDRVRDIQNLYADEQRIAVVSYDDLTIDLAHRVGADYIVRGVRSVADFEYERQLAEVNKKMGNVETILLYASTEFSSISSTAVRVLKSFGKDVAWMLPSKI